jgi:transcription-repair coupling factor (superfamily II helicase)
VRRARRRKLDNFISEVTSLVGRRHRRPCRARHRPFRRAADAEVGGAPHDCLELRYANETKLFLPVENIELAVALWLRRRMSTLDKLGGGAWQARKAKLKNRSRTWPAN